MCVSHRLSRLVPLVKCGSFGFSPSFLLHRLIMCQELAFHHVWKITPTFANKSTRVVGSLCVCITLGNFRFDGLLMFSDSSLEDVK